MLKKDKKSLDSRYSTMYTERRLDEYRMYIGVVELVSKAHMQCATL